MARTIFLAAVMAVASLPAFAHFQELIPERDIVTSEGGKSVGLSLTFTHPMDDGPAMEMGRPKRFGVLAGGQVRDLTASLKPRKLQGKTAYTSGYSFTAPGDHLFFVEPAPYWEPGEGKWIIHYTKVAVNAFGEEEGWDANVGLPVEIEPLTRPYGVWTGNLFRGVVRKDGKPVPGATVEVEYRSEGKVKAPADPFVTQVIKADANGVFAYAMPRAGWWGFAALVDGDEKIPAPDGKPADVELGGLIWVRAQDMK
jgi:cobalt/nickel transport protein